MQVNEVSVRTKNANYLKQKTKCFQQNYQQSAGRMKSRSSMHNLAGTIYSAKTNKQFSPTKALLRNLSSTRVSLRMDNPQMLKQKAILTSLNMRTSHIPNFSDLNTQLLVEKKRLQDKIKFTKQQIAKQTRLRNKADYNCRKNHNLKDNGYDSFQEYSRRSDKLESQIADTQNDNRILRNNIHNLQKQNQDRKNNDVKNTMDCNENLDNKVKMLKSNLMMEEKNRNFLKSELIKQQKIMNSASICSKELQNQRAFMLIEVNKYVSDNKL